MDRNQSQNSWDIIKNHAKHVSTLPEATTIDPTVGFPISLLFWKLYIQRFHGTQDQPNLSLGRPLNMCSKLNQIKQELLMSAGVTGSHYKAASVKWTPYNGGRKGSVLAYKYIQTSHFAGKRRFWVAGAFSRHFSFSFLYISIPKRPSNTSNHLWFFSFH